MPLPHTDPTDPTDLTDFTGFSFVGGKSHGGSHGSHGSHRVFLCGWEISRRLTRIPRISRIFLWDLWFGTNFFGRNGGEIGKKCVTLHFDDKPRKNTLNN